MIGNIANDEGKEIVANSNPNLWVLDEWTQNQ